MNSLPNTPPLPTGLPNSPPPPTGLPAEGISNKWVNAEKPPRDNFIPSSYIDGMLAKINDPPVAVVSTTKIWQDETSKSASQKAWVMVKKLVNSVAVFFNAKLPAFAPIREKYTALIDQANKVFTGETKATSTEMEALSQKMSKALKTVEKLINKKTAFSDEKNAEVTVLRDQLRVALSNVNGKLQLARHNLNQVTQTPIHPPKSALDAQTILSNPALPQNSSSSELDKYLNSAGYQAAIAKSPLKDTSKKTDEYLKEIGEYLNSAGYQAALVKAGLLSSKESPVIENEINMQQMAERFAEKGLDSESSVAKAPDIEKIAEGLSGGELINMLEDHVLTFEESPFEELEVNTTNLQSVENLSHPPTNMAIEPSHSIEERPPIDGARVENLANPESAALFLALSRPYTQY